MPDPTATISNANVLDALRRSGYLIEYRVEAVLRDLGFHVDANTTFPDPITQKPRELDLFGMGAALIGKPARDFIFPVFLIECVNNQSFPIAFLTKKGQPQILYVYDQISSGLPSHVLSNKWRSGWEPIGSFLQFDKFHHHCADDPVATQFCSFAPKKGSRPTEWMAFHEGTHFDSFNKLCAAVNHYREEHFLNTVPVRDDRIRLQIYYPIVVLGGKILNVKHNEGGLEAEETDHVHYIQSSLAAEKELRYHIDVVTDNFLPTLLNQINKECNIIAKRARKKRKKMYEAIDAMAKIAKNHPDEVQDIIRPYPLTPA